jgi:hypothetical protein
VFKEVGLGRFGPSSFTLNAASTNRTWIIVTDVYILNRVFKEVGLGRFSPSSFTLNAASTNRTWIIVTDDFTIRIFDVNVPSILQQQQLQAQSKVYAL